MILIISNSHDLATDFVVAELIRRSAEYHRLDLDLLHTEGVILDPLAQVLSVESEHKRFQVSGDSLRSILFRAPTHLRESSTGRLEPNELLGRHQWAAFARSLTVFRQARWVNHPRDTYLAENKPYQLAVAITVGFSVPATKITNAVADATDPVWDSSKCAAVKALDSFLVRLDSDEDAFFYTQKVCLDELQDKHLADMPVILQHWLMDKTDLRVTVVGQNCFAAAVSVDGQSIDGDWRLAKDKAQFIAVELPTTVAEQCVKLVESLGLIFGAIDLALVGGTYYFLEVNPTGEWGWLVDSLGFPIHEAIADELTQ